MAIQPDGFDHVDATKARENFAELVNRAAYGHQRIVLERHGKPCAAIVSVDDLETLRAIEAREDAEDEAAALAFEKEREAGPVETVSLTEFRRKHGL